jgi:DTW domain-containing protein YfiP
MRNPRDTCPSCRKAVITCYCARLTPFEAGAVFAVLIHPKETRKRIGTGRMTHLALRDSRLIDGLDFTVDQRVTALIADPSLFPVVLYPGPHALDLSTTSAEAAREFFPAGRKPLIFVVDGTWPSARKMIRLSANLRALPQIRFTPPRLSEYSRIREQPRPYCFSTVEAVHVMIDRLAALGVVPEPPGRPHDAMLAAFHAMVDQQERFGNEVAHGASG